LGEPLIEKAQSLGKLLAVPGMAGSLKLTENAAAGEFDTFPLPL
jgi:hypothetical protein